MSCGLYTTVLPSFNRDNVSSFTIMTRVSTGKIIVLEFCGIMAYTFKVILWTALDQKQFTAYNFSCLGLVFFSATPERSFCVKTEFCMKRKPQSFLFILPLEQCPMPCQHRTGAQDISENYNWHRILRRERMLALISSSFRIRNRLCSALLQSRCASRGFEGMGLEE